MPATGTVLVRTTPWKPNSNSRSCDPVNGSQQTSVHPERNGLGCDKQED